MDGDGSKKVKTRVNRIAGQVAGIQRMVDEGRYCVEILNQIAAVRSALDALGIDVAPAVHHVVHRGLPRALLRKAQARGIDAIADGEGGLHHRSILLAGPALRASVRLKRAEQTQ